ncbi:MAG TPA: glycosyltransferase family 39 protein [bacterium]|nr:glycosyltransferase family 39 protein [bacterium]
MTLLIAAWIYLVTVSLGSFLLNRFGFSFQNSLEKGGFSFALGYGLLGYLVLILGFLKLLYFWAALIMLVLLTLFLIRQEIFWMKWAVRIPKRVFGLKKSDPWSFYFALGAIFVVSLAVAQSLIPPTAHDALCYHLNLPKRFVAAGQVQYFPYLVNSLFPFIIEMHFTLALLFGQPALANVFHLFTGLGMLMGVTALGRRLAGNRTGIAAGLILILTPGIFNQMVITYNDVGLAFFCFFAFYALLKVFEDSNSEVWFVLMGSFSGFAMSVKYLALFHIAAIFFAALISGFILKKDLKKILKGLLIYFFFTAFFCFIWYLRSWLHEKNPVYPFFPEIFGGTGKAYDFERAGMGKGILDFILVFWRLTMNPQKFGGTWAQLGLCYLTFLPLLFLSKKLNLQTRKGLTPFVVFSFAYFLFWFLTVQNLRFLFPLLPVLCVLIALVARPFAVWLTLLLLLNTAFAIYHGKSGYAYLLGRESRASYLAKEERTYPLSEWINGNLPKAAKILNVEEVRMFYFDPEMVREREFRKKTRYDEKSEMPEDGIALLRQSGITHILFVRDEDPEAEKLPPLAIRRLLLDENFKSSFLILLHEEKAADGTQYEVYELRK